MTVSAQEIRELRQRSSAGILDCRKALVECDGDLDSALDWLRKKGLSDAARKAGRVAAEGLIGIAVGERAGAIVEVNSETDFVARNPVFQSLVTEIAETALQTDPGVEALLEAALPGASGETVASRVQSVIAAVGENITLRRVALMPVNDGTISSYVHSSVAPNLGKIGVLVAIGGEAEAGELGHQIAMHVAASAPLAITADGFAPELIERERAILEARATESGKPPEIQERMIAGGLKRMAKESALLEQPFVVEPDLTVGAAIARHGEKSGAVISVTAFQRFAVGEGLAKREDDFVAEVRRMAGD